MGVKAALARFAAGAAVPVFPVVGMGAREAVQDLRLQPQVRLVDAPRGGEVLLLAGRLPDALTTAADAAHDVMAAPRCTVRWSPGGEGRLVDAVVAAHRELLAGEWPSEPAWLPDTDPNPWRGVGPYGQGGTGMTGGVPYGRPMTERADDRDGLTLDQLRLRVGPLFSGFPSGLAVDVAMQGDVLQQATVADNPFEGFAEDEVSPLLRPFLRAVHEPVPIAELEVARARRHLRWLAEALRVHGLSALGQRVLRLAHRVQPGEGAAVRRLGHRLQHTRVLGWATRGLGEMLPEVLERLGGGPVARAAGVADDVRGADPAYRRLGFEPVVGTGSDASGRWCQHLAEAAQSLDLAARAGQARAGGVGQVEAPGGRLDGASSTTGGLLDVLDELLIGMEWGEAVTTVVSVAVDLEEAAVPTRAGQRG